MNTMQVFEDAIAFELLLVQTVLDAGESPSRDTIDLTDPSGKPTSSYCSSVSWSDNDVNELQANLMPLIFGAGWKIIDLIIEHEVSLAGLNPSNNIISISKKKIMP